jgi:hypothetical protein
MFVSDFHKNKPVIYLNVEVYQIIVYGSVQVYPYFLQEFHVDFIKRKGRDPITYRQVYDHYR